MPKSTFGNHETTTDGGDLSDQHRPIGNYSSMESALKMLVYHYLDCYMYTNAMFLCERLVACKPSEENALLLATCYVRESQDLRAHGLLQGCRLPQSR